MANVSKVDEYVGGPGLSDKDAQYIKGLIDEIERVRGRQSTTDLAGDIVARARAKDCPIHHLFEWDREKGFAIYLIERAKDIVARVRVRWVDMPDAPVRAFRVVDCDGKRGPMEIRKILSRPEVAAGMLEEAKVALESWRFRYRQLEKMREMVGVFREVDKVLRKKRQ